MKIKQQELQRTVLRIVRRVIRNEQTTSRLEHLVSGIVDERCSSDDGLSGHELISYVVRQICERLIRQRVSNSDVIEQFNTNTYSELDTTRY